ncbi:arabinofuranosidase catalytic domain-containing protein [Streptomyces sp. NPDC059161]|uniref:arabinofuranosidase catalytic domain-containing protein n=1 Tax=Streptomyces sp. NPDC059161 TaxID=3346749 RepID=UPI00369EAF98
MSVVLGMLPVLPGASQAASPLACDIYGSAGTPCVAAHSATRAFISAYNSPLHQVKWASDSAVKYIAATGRGG